MLFWFQRRERHENFGFTEDGSEEALLARCTEIVELWERMRSWFLKQGYKLYKTDAFGYCTPTISIGEEPEWPYAYYGGDPSFGCPNPLEARLTNKVGFAQDLQGRHVAIKRLGILDDTEEERINHWLYENREEASKNCILPIIEILQYENSSFAVMPRWGDKPCEFRTVGESMSFIHCLLKAINFLHSHSIIHRDISENNLLVNHFGSVEFLENNSLRPRLRSEGKLRYALFDFDLAMMLSHVERRLPAYRSFEIVNIQKPNDTRQGELDYDPFKFEMGCIGIELCEYFQHYTPIIPMLAPFLDRLVTDDLAKRFTSSEALAFLEQMCAELSPEQLAERVPAGSSPWDIETYDRWNGLPNDFLKKWVEFRAPKPSLYTRVLRRLCTTYWGLRFVTFFRKFIRKLRF